jgi:tRNA dimethylallyltransferase
MKRRTRRYARRQLTWMRRLPNVALVDVTGRGADEVAGELEKIVDIDDRGRLGHRGDA